MQLNYHHLRYFWTIAREKSLTRAAKVLHVSASALSTQLRALESSLGQALFDRRQKSLVLTEAGRVALAHAETIFRTGAELLDTFSGGTITRRQVVRVGAMATLSRNFQIEFLRPVLGEPDVQVVLRSGNLRDLLVQLEALAVDLVLSTQPVRTDLDRQLTSHRLAEYPVSLVGTRKVRLARGAFPLNLRQVPLVLPSRESSIRAPFDALLADAGVVPLVAAEVDDMAMLRLLAREGLGLALVPAVAVRDELRDGRLLEAVRVPGLTKTFYAITQSRRFPNPLVRRLMEQAIRSADKPSGAQGRRGRR